MKYKKLYENNTSIQDVIDYINANTRPHFVKDNKFDVRLIDGEYVIYANKLHLRPVDAELKYNIKRCDDFTIIGENIKSFKNLPTMPYVSIEASLTYDECPSLDFKDFKISNNIQTAVTLRRLPNIDPNVLPNNITNLKIIFCDSEVLHDFSKYNNSIKHMKLLPNAKMKCLPHILLTNLIDFVFEIHMCNYYKWGELFLFNNLIESYILKKNREDYVMDMTLVLIEQGFEDEV